MDLHKDNGKSYLFCILIRQLDRLVIGGRQQTLLGVLVLYFLDYFLSNSSFFLKNYTPGEKKTSQGSKRLRLLNVVVMAHL